MREHFVTPKSRSVEKGLAESGKLALARQVPLAKGDGHDDAHSDRRTSPRSTTLLSARTSPTQPCIAYRCPDSGHNVAFAHPLPLGSTSGPSPLSSSITSRQGGKTT